MTNYILVLVFATCLIVNIVLAGHAYGQTESEQTSSAKQKDILTILKDMDALLPALIPVLLAGLGLSAGAFLEGYTPNAQYVQNIEKAKEDFITSFFILIICTASIYAFDFIETFGELSFETRTVDLVSKYGLFFASLILLSHGAKEVYVSLIGLAIQAVDREKVLKFVTESNESLSVSQVAKKAQLGDRQTKLILDELSETHQIEKTGWARWSHYKKLQ